MSLEYPETGFARERQILGDKNSDPPVPAIIPVCRASWWNGIRDGKYPKPVKLGPKTTAWRWEDIRALVERISQGGDNA